MCLYVWCICMYVCLYMCVCGVLHVFGAYLILNILNDLVIFLNVVKCMIKMFVVEIFHFEINFLC